MDDQARRSHKKTDHTMVEAFGKRWGNHSSFKVGAIDRSGYPTFTVNHFNGPVTYSSDGFLDRNLDSLNPDFVSLLRGSSRVGSINPFVKGIFSGKAIATQAHPKNEDTIVSAQQPVKPMRAPSTRRKGTVKRMPMLREDGAGDEQDREEDDMSNPSGLTPCVAGEFRAALDTLFETLSETQSWFVFCVNPNDSQLPNQLEGRSVKGQIRSMGLTEVSKRNVNVFEVGLTPDEFCARYKEPMMKMGVVDGSAKEKVEQTRNILGLQEIEIVLGQYKVFLSQSAFHSLEDRIRALDVEEQKRNPNASPFQRGDLYDDEYEDRKSFRSDDFDNRSRLTSNREETNF
ncbi:P-loop containing nucleoside triphosphate hydrolase protein [Butyriboletus roseoflavus]|nr:P-loop containing nucleoside triphosphate hydrolase protein [Butyriboletus roseoflavus]